MWRSHYHDDRYGPRAAAYRGKEEAYVDTPRGSKIVGGSQRGSALVEPYPGT